MASRRLLSLKRLHRTTAIRIIRIYWTISYASASVLAASPPFELQVLAFRRVYENLSGLGSGEDCYPKLDLRNDSFRLGEDAGALRQQFERGPGIFLLTHRGVSVGKGLPLPPASQK